MDLRNSNGIELRNFTLQPYRSFFQNFSSEVCGKSFYAFEDIDVRESHAKLRKKPCETLGADLI